MPTVAWCLRLRDHVNMRWIGILLSLVCCSASAQLGTLPYSGAPAGTTWQTLRIGAGGFITGIDVATDGTKVVRTDSYGAYWFNPSAPNPGNAGGIGSWQQIVSVASMPAADAGLDLNAGVYEIAVASSNTARFYMYFNGYVFRTDNSGTTWIRTAFANISAAPNDANRTMGRGIAVDPINADHVLVGTPASGLWRSTDAGATWNKVSGVANGSPAGGGTFGVIVAFDASSAPTGGKTSIVYVSSYGTGVYKSTDAAATFTLTTGTPTTHTHMIVDQNGVVWLVDNGSGGSSGALRKFASGSWSTIGGAGTCHSVAIDPANASRIFVGTTGGVITLSVNGGSTWATGNATADVATDIPWFTSSDNSAFRSNGDMKFDPSGSNLMYFAEGIGVWKTNPPNTNVPTITWTSQSAAIEQLVSNAIISPPTGKPLALSWDRAVFYSNNPNVYPSTVGPSSTFVAGWHADYVTGTPSTIVGIFNFTNGTENSGISVDGGQTWTGFVGKPSSVVSPNRHIGGSIAASTTTNFVWAPEEFSIGGQNEFNNPAFTTNGGSTWTNSTFPAAVATNASTGWGSNYANNQFVVAADRVTTGKFLIYNYGPGFDATTEGFYLSTNGGANFSRVSQPGFFALTNAKLRSVPGNAGHYFFTAGPQLGSAHPVNQPFYQSTDSGSTWNAIANVKEVYAFGFGKAKASGYPAIYIFGWISNVLGIWRSDDQAVTWARISDGFPINSFDWIKFVEGDSNTYGTVYVGFGGSGFAYGKINYLLKRDLNPANDNTPMWLNEAA